MDYTQRNKENAPHAFMRNAFVDISTDELQEIRKYLIEELAVAKATIVCNKMEIETIDWELSHRD